MAAWLGWFVVVGVALAAATALDNSTDHRLHVEVFRQRLREYLGCTPCDAGLCPGLPEKCLETVMEIGVCACCRVCALTEGSPCGVYTPPSGVYTHSRGVYTPPCGVYTPPGVYTHSRGVYTPHCGVYTRLCGVYTPLCRVYMRSVHSSLRSVHSSLRSVHSSLWSVHSSFWSVHSFTRSVHSSLRSVHSSLCRSSLVHTSVSQSRQRERCSSTAAEPRHLSTFSPRSVQLDLDLTFSIALRSWSYKTKKNEFLYEFNSDLAFTSL